MENQIVYRHIRTTNGKDKTIAAKLVNNHYEYGIAHCSKNDQYCKKTGRELAESRMVNTLSMDNVLIILNNMNSVFIPTSQKRIQKEFKISDFKVEIIMNLIMEEEGL